MSIFIDTGVFVGYINKKDEHHDVAVNLLEDIMRNRYRAPFTSDYIFDEAVTVALYRTGDFRKAIDVGELIIGNKEKEIAQFVNILPVSKIVFNEAWKIFLKYRNKMLSFTDCTSIALIKEREIDYIASFDEDFNGIVNRVAE
ncbi:MAG: type II toxin-antitoxin system VapC family toxin [Desulfurococcales archaeon]|nr:type II toxin-antitoxin system VapC family toxin [Desulfurococcales archaeon]